MIGSVKRKIIMYALTAAAVGTAATGGFLYGDHKGYERRDAIAVADIAEHAKEVAQLNEKITKAESEINEVIVIEYRDRVKTVTEVVTVNNDVIREVVPEQFQVSEGWVYAHNQAVAGEIIDPSLASNATPSQFSDTYALNIVSANYGKAKICYAKDEVWRSWQAQVENYYEQLQD